MFKNINDIIFISVMVLNIYYFRNLKKYCVTTNDTCINDPKRYIIEKTSIFMLVVILIIRLSDGVFLDKLLGLNVNKNLTWKIENKKTSMIIIFVFLIIIMGVSIYRMMNVFNYTKQLKEECNCKEYTLEYYIIKYHNYFQIGLLWLFFFILISIALTSKLFMKYKNN